MMKSIVAKMGIVREDVEDVAHEILLKFMEKDALTWFDADRVFDAGENPRTEGGRWRAARFSNLLRSFTQRYCLQYLDKQRNLAKREPEFAKLDAVVGGEEDSGMTWGEAHQDRWQPAEMEKAIESRLVLVSVMTTAEVRARHTAEVAEASATETVWKQRRQAQAAARDAQRHHEGMQAVMRLAEAGEAVTGASLARMCGWSSRVGIEVLKGVRQELRAVGL
jgi:hypothetical protein